MIKLYNDDCIKIMKEEISNESVDLIVTDPPYLISYSRHVKGHRFSKTIQNDDNESLIAEYIKECHRILKNDSAMYMFASHKTIDYFKQQLEKYFNVKNIIIWDKIQQNMGDTSTTFGFQYEIIFFVSKGQPKINGKRLSDIWSFPKITGEYQQHQNQKPVALIEQCIEKHSKVGDVVFDGFMGSGTTGVACKNLDRNFIGIEIDKTYFEMAQKRINEKMVQISLF